MSTATITNPADVRMLAELDSMGIKTVRDLGNYAHDNGIQASELLERLSA